MKDAAAPVPAAAAGAGLGRRRVLDINVLGTVNTTRIFEPGMRERGWGRMVNLASMAGKDGNTCRGLRLVANAWRLYRQAVLQPALSRRAVLLALIPDADCGRDESGRKVLDASGAEGQQEHASLRARRAVQLRMHAEGAIDDGELKASMETVRAREAAIAAERASIGEHSPWRAPPGVPTLRGSGTG
jgi:hypothetical protein